jgi:GT2 family glycosyltransferase
MPLVQFPSTDSPVISVVVLAWKQTDRLIACLTALAASTDAPAFEVVLVLNGASPEVRRLVAEGVDGAQIVDIEANIGFGGGCNAGIDRARGGFILLLNDDATVDPHLLARSFARIDAESDVAAVAAVLVNPDGTLQEAGSRVLDSAATVQLGAGLALDSDEARAFLTPRDIDYGSAAALLVRRSALDAIGGFDPIYEPAYFEDVDLAFRLKENGWRVVLEPSARATHAAGSSTSTDTRFRRFASDHAGTAFIDRWGTVLADAPQRDADPSALLHVPRADRAAAPRSTASPSATAASIATGYAAWLADALDHLEAEHADDVARLAAEREEARQLREKVDSLNTIAHELKTRLDDLEARGPVGVVKWQVGLFKLRHARD